MESKSSKAGNFTKWPPNQARQKPKVFISNMGNQIYYQKLNLTNDDLKNHDYLQYDVFELVKTPFTLNKKWCKFGGLEVHKLESKSES